MLLIRYDAWAMKYASLALPLLMLGCGSSDAHRKERRSIEDVPVTSSFLIEGLAKPVHVLTTEGGVPHVYAASEMDAYRAVGFLQARDRFVQMELTRRFGQGRLSELIGDAALATDQETRARGANDITDRILSQLSPEEGAVLDAYAAGINTYIHLFQADPFRTDLPVPTELPLVGAILGTTDFTSLLTDYDRRDVVSMLTAVLFNSSFAADDLDRQAAFDGIPDLFVGAPNATLREAGVREDLFDWVTPVHPISSAAGFGLETIASADVTTPRGGRVPKSLLASARARIARFDRIRRGERGADYGSNAWAVGARGTPAGTTLVAGDGHLPLSVPALLYQLGVDTTVYGGRGGRTLLGLFFPGVPVMPVGTNGHVAFSFTYLYGDQTDWYAESITLDANGAPASSLFQGQQRPLVPATEVYEVANVPGLGSVGRTETTTRYATFDGRVLTDIEGDPAPPGTIPAAGQTIVNLAGVAVIPRDVDGDGTISAISFDYTGFDASNLFKAVRDADAARTVQDFEAAQRQFIGFAQNFVAGDGEGNVYYSGYTGVPCRSGLPRVGTGAATRFADGADPRRVLDGTRFGAFTVPVGRDNRVDETLGATDPSRCVVPFARWPRATNPPSGFAFTANNDLGGTSFDGSLANDEYYVGGTFSEGYRAKTISETLAAHVAARDASVEAMAALQANHTSVVGREFVPYLRSAVGEARALTAPSGAEEGRVRALYLGSQAAIDEAMGRLDAWIAAGADAASGVDTFYATSSASERTDAAATMIFNAFFRHLTRRVFGDEGMDAVLSLDARFMYVTSLRRFFDGRGVGNTANIASYDPTTMESVFFDDVTTPGVVESSREILLLALGDALAELAGPGDGAGGGGFGSADQSTWLWGLRHTVAFPSLIEAYAGDVDGVDLIANLTQISTVRLPLASGLAPQDPRAQLTWFPRPGDWFNVDAGHPSLGGTDYGYRSGPVMRMVVELGPRGFVRGQNILPAGQSGIASSSHFDDQAALWLGNRTVPMRFDVADVVSHALSHEVFE